jgi:hypothetical protein
MKYQEQMSGLSLIDARDLNDAIRPASGIPWARLGSVGGAGGKGNTGRR